MSKAPLIYYVEDDEHIRDLTAYRAASSGYGSACVPRWRRSC
ncbi:MAG: hypothetical protein ACLTSX_13220 [Collinsella sp.]